MGQAADRKAESNKAQREILERIHAGQSTFDMKEPEG